jgi:hypothetical protein
MRTRWLGRTARERCGRVAATRGRGFFPFAAHFRVLSVRLICFF